MIWVLGVLVKMCVCRMGVCGVFRVACVFIISFFLVGSLPELGFGFVMQRFMAVFEQSRLRSV